MSCNFIYFYLTYYLFQSEVKCKQTDPEKIINTFSKLLPCTNEQARRYIKVVDLSQATQTADLCLLEETDDNKFTCKWNGTIPSKSMFNLFLNK